MADLTDLQAAQSVKIIGANSSGIETNPVNSDVNGNLQVKEYSNGVPGSLVPSTALQIAGTDGTNLQTLKVTSLGQPIIVGSGISGIPTGGVLTTQYAEPQTYSAAASNFVCAAAATDVFTITGSATKIIRIHKIKVSATTTSGSSIKVNFQLVKRSTADSAGTRVAVTAVPYDSNNAAASGTVGSYTANPTLGTAVGTLRADSNSVSITGVSGGVIEWAFNESPNQPIYLRGIAEQLSVNFNGATITGPLVSILIEWSEV